MFDDDPGVASWMIAAGMQDHIASGEKEDEKDTKIHIKLKNSGFMLDFCC